VLPSPDGGADGDDIPLNHRQKETIVPNKASYKSKGGKKDAATKHALNVPSGGREPDIESKGSEEQDPKRKIGQFGDAGQPPIMKR
jgi:hypothetical protein